MSFDRKMVCREDIRAYRVVFDTLVGTTIDGKVFKKLSWIAIAKMVIRGHREGFGRY